MTAFLSGHMRPVSWTENAPACTSTFSDTDTPLRLVTAHDVKEVLIAAHKKISDNNFYASEEDR